MGLTNWLKPTDIGHWEMNPKTGIARCPLPNPPPPAGEGGVGVSTELETCAACHSRRMVIAKNAAPGAPYLDAYLPALLKSGLYDTDGQIDGEVYEYGSFLQNRIHATIRTAPSCAAKAMRCAPSATCPKNSTRRRTNITAPVVPARSV